MSFMSYIDLEHLVVGMGFIGDINGYRNRPEFVFYPTVKHYRISVLLLRYKLF